MDRYRVYDWRSGLRVWPGVLVFLVLGYVLGFHEDQPVGAVVVAVVLVLVGGWLMRRRALRFRADANGIMLAAPVAGAADLSATRRREVGWGSVDTVTVAGERVCVTLRHDAPLPGWMTARISDPSNPDDQVVIADDVAGIDPHRLQAVLHSAAPGVRFRC
jgi:hypothetical protein